MVFLGGCCRSLVIRLCVCAALLHRWFYLCPSLTAMMGAHGKQIHGESVFLRKDRDMERNMLFPLERRVTHTYVGEFAHLDDWENLGQFFREGGFCSWEDKDGVTCSYFTVRVILNDTTVDPVEVAAAIADTLTVSGCACEHDCCGCVSIHAEAKHLHGGTYKVKTEEFANY